MKLRLAYFKKQRWFYLCTVFHSTFPKTFESCNFRKVYDFPPLEIFHKLLGSIKICAICQYQTSSGPWPLPRSVYQGMRMLVKSSMEIGKHFQRTSLQNLLLALEITGNGITLQYQILQLIYFKDKRAISASRY